MTLLTAPDSFSNLPPVRAWGYGGSCQELSGMTADLEDAPGVSSSDPSPAGPRQERHAPPPASGNAVTREVTDVTAVTDHPRTCPTPRKDRT